MLARDRLTVLSYDEMAVSNQIALDVKNQQIIGPHRNVQVIFSRGLFSNWKQPIFYSFDEPMTIDIAI